MASRRKRSGLDERIDGLYGLPREEFTAARNALAKELRSEGQGEDASRVGKLAKPSVPAAAINQAVRADPAAARELVQSAEALGAAQSDALRGGGGAALRKAMRAQRAAVERMMAAVERELGPRGPSTSVRGRIEETLRGVAGDEEMRAEFAAGRLARDRPGGTGLGETETGAAKRPRSRPTGASKRRAERLRRAEATLKRATSALRAQERRADQARERVERAEGRLADAKRALDEAEGERAERERELGDAQAVVEELRED